MKEALAIFLKLDIKLLAVLLVPAAIYGYTNGVTAGIKLLVLCFLVPQPFLFYAFKELIFHKPRKPGSNSD